MIVSTIPGKIILSGEHAAVYGKLALAASIDLGVTVKINKNQNARRKNPVDKKGLVTKAIEVAGGGDNIGVEIESTLPVGSGLGSSAAIAAAVIRGVREYCGKPVDNDELFKLTMECEKIAHGTPSGLDPATVIYGGLVEFTKGQPIKKLKIAKPIKLLVFNSGIPEESSREMIVEVVGNNPDKLVFVDAIGRVTEKIRDAIVVGKNIVELINENGILLEQLGVVGTKAKKICKELRKLGYGVKVAGAGGVRAGSGMLLIVGDDMAKAKELLKKENLDYFETMVGEK